MVPAMRLAEQCRLALGTRKVWCCIARMPWKQLQDSSFAQEELCIIVTFDAAPPNRFIYLPDSYWESKIIGMGETAVEAWQSAIKGTRIRRVKYVKQD